MRRFWVLPAVVLFLGCEALSPALKYEEAARQLRFSLDRVDPKVERIWKIVTAWLLPMDHPPGLDLMPRPVRHRGKTVYVFPCWVCKGQRYLPGVKMLGDERVCDETRKRSACFECDGKAWVEGMAGVPYAR